MSKRPRRVKNPVVHEALQWHAEMLHLELVAYKHITPNNIQAAYHVMHQLDVQLSKKRTLVESFTDGKTGLEITVRRA